MTNSPDRCSADSESVPAESRLADAVLSLEYYIGNPSAWDHFDDAMSERLRNIVDMARRIRTIAVESRL